MKKTVHHQQIEGEAAVITTCGLCLWKNQYLPERVTTAWHLTTCRNCLRRMAKVR